MEAHLFGPAVENADAEPPFVALLVSGGHTLLLHAPAWGEYLLLGETRDDAAGEAFDKVARLLGLSYPGGPAVAALAEQGDPAAFELPRPMLRTNQRAPDADYFDFSFSGLKTAVLEVVRRQASAGVLEARRADVAASFQAAVVEVLVEKTLRAARFVDCTRVLLGGGVSANRHLRERMRDRIEPLGGRVLWASPRLSLDNGAMVARAGRFHLDRGEFAGPAATASPALPFPGLTRHLIA
jgi:N6-L-threonylcarbamoyladenine synthase